MLAEPVQWQLGRLVLPRRKFLDDLRRRKTLADFVDRLLELLLPNDQRVPPSTAYQQTERVGQRGPSPPKRIEGRRIGRRAFLDFSLCLMAKACNELQRHHGRIPLEG